MSTHAHPEAATLTHEASYMLHQPYPNLALSEAPGKLDIHLIPGLKARFNSPVLALYTQLQKTETKATVDRLDGAHDTRTAPDPGGQQQSKTTELRPRQQILLPGGQTQVTYLHF